MQCPFRLARLKGLEPPTYWFVADSFSSFAFVSNQKTAILSHLFYLSFGYSIIFSGLFWRTRALNVRQKQEISSPLTSGFISPLEGEMFPPLFSLKTTSQ